MILVLPSGAARADNGGSPSGELRLKMASFNIRYLTTRDKGDNHWKTRQSRTVAAIRQFDADVIRQETSRYIDSSRALGEAVFSRFIDVFDLPARKRMLPTR